MDRKLFASSIESKINEQNKADYFAIEILGVTVKHRSGFPEDLK
jgi:hypothetical protein